MSQNYVLAITGASGSAYAIRLAQQLLVSGQTVHLVMSNAAGQVMQRELNTDPPHVQASSDEWKKFLDEVLFLTTTPDWGFHRTAAASTAHGLFVHGLHDFSAGIASGSFLTAGMVVCPCSMGTLSAVASGASSNLIHRAADVHLKERRPLVMVPRETPLSSIALDNMARLSHAGATILPAMPGLYHQPVSIADLIDFVVARICDHLHVEHQLIRRWGNE